MLADDAAALTAAGAELLVLCTNTMHKIAGEIAGAIDVPFVHIADTTAEAVRAAGLQGVGLLAYDELCLGRVEDRSREEYRRIIRGLVADGAEGILLGCTEVDLLIGADDSPVPVFDTTALHAERAAELALA